MARSPARNATAHEVSSDTQMASRAVDVHARDVVASYRGTPVRSERGEIATDQNLAVRLHHGDAHQTVRVRIKTIKGRVGINKD